MSDALSTAPQSQAPAKAFTLLFFIELWERFGFYGVSSLLVLYMSKDFHFSDHEAYSTFATLSALIYLGPIVGGYLGDKIIGYQRTLASGALLLSLGYAGLAFLPTKDFYWSLAFVIIGSAFFKTAPSALVAKLYDKDKSGLDAAFTIFYMSINIGGIASTLICGFLAQRYNWHSAFAVCAAGMFLGLILYIVFKYLLRNIGSPADFQKTSMIKNINLLFGALISICLGVYLLKHQAIFHQALLVITVLLTAYFIMLLWQMDKIGKRKFFACLILIVFAISFFMLYFQAPMTINLFIDRNVDRHVFGVLIPTSSFWGLNPLWIVILAPLLAKMYTALSKNKGDLSVPFKFALGIILTGTGFLVLNWCQYFANGQHMVSAWWIVLSYFLQSSGELFISALGLSMIARLVPPSLMGMMMGTWFIASAISATLAGKFAQMTDIPKGVTDPAITLPIYNHAFLIYGGLSVGIGIIALLLVRPLNKLINE